jgi:hypothetical protein
MPKPRIFAAAAVAVGSALTIYAASTAGAPSASSVGAQIEPLPMMAHAHGLPAQRMTDCSLVFTAPMVP